MKPVSGGLDLVSKTTEGIKNTAHIFDKKKADEDERVRLPRIFYEKPQIVSNLSNLQIKEYDEGHSVAEYLIKQADNNKFKDDNFVNAIQIDEVNKLLLYIST